MNDETEVLDREEQVGKPMPSRPTKRDLIERGLEVIDPKQKGGAAVSMTAGCIAFAKFEDVMNFATAIATAGILLPKYLQGNPGACLGLTIQAIEWRMSPIQVMQKSYEVNGRVGYESQLIHAVIEARAPLQHRLDCRYDGEGQTRVCTVIGHFTSGDTREYESPMFKDIRVKNSPLWKDDPDQQLFYYASRSWARKWCPDVLMGIYSREELAQQPDYGREGEDNTAPGLHARLVGSPRTDEGHRIGHVESELAQIAAGVATPLQEAGKETPAEAEAIEDTRKANKRTSDRLIGGKKRTKAEKKPKEPVAQEEAEPARVVVAFPPKTVKRYIEWATDWIATVQTSEALTAQWNKERKLRNDLGMTEDDRKPLLELIAERREQLEK